MGKQTPFNKLINSAGSATKTFLGLGANVSSTSLTAGDYRGGAQPFGKQGWLFDLPNGMDVHFSFDGLSDVVKAYENCPPIFSIVNKQAYAFINGNVVITNVKGKGKGKEATGDWANKVRALMKNPNPLQNWKQFEAQMAIFLRLFGYCVILPIKPVGFPNSDATALWIIPPYLCQFKFSRNTYFNLKKGWIESVTVSYGTEKTVITDPDRLIIIKDITPGFDNPALPGCPIKPLQQNINNLIGLYESKGVLINYRGALGILSPELDPQGAISIDPTEKSDLEMGLMRFGLRANQSKFIIANSSMDWKSMLMPYKDLCLTEWEEDEVRVCCGVLNYPFELMPNGKASSLGGTEVDAFKKQLYVDFEIPFGEMVYEQLADAFEAAKNGCDITKDFRHIQCLQDDSLKAAQSRKQRNDALLIEFYNNQITLDRWNELNGEDPVQGDHGSKYYSELVALGWKFGTTAANVTIGTTQDTAAQTTAPSTSGAAT